MKQLAALGVVASFPTAAVFAAPLFASGEATTELKELTQVVDSKIVVIIWAITVVALIPLLKWLAKVAVESVMQQAEALKTKVEQQSGQLEALHGKHEEFSRECNRTTALAHTTATTALTEVLRLRPHVEEGITSIAALEPRVDRTEKDVERLYVNILELSNGRRS